MQKRKVRVLKYFEDKYSDGRSPIDTGLIAKILRESLSLAGAPVIDEAICQAAASMFIACINYYFYLHPEQYIDFGKFVAYRNVDLKNLLVIEAKESENANSIYNYYKDGGIQAELLKIMINNFAADLVVKSMADEEAAKEDIEKLKGLTSQSKTSNYNNNKGEENGI